VSSKKPSVGVKLFHWTLGQVEQIFWQFFCIKSTTSSWKFFTGRLDCPILILVTWKLLTEL